MKIAVTGKGGVGKTTLAAALALLFSRDGIKVVAIDGDPDSNLAATLGFPEAEKIVPLAEMKQLIAERTGVKEGVIGSYFKLNPRVDDIPERFCPEYKGIRLMVMGGIRSGGSGCFCPENAFLKSLLAHLLIARDEVVILDMEAGVEHLSRGTAAAVDALILVVEPTKRSIETALRIKRLASDLQIKKVFVVPNKLRTKADADFIKSNLQGLEFLGSIRYYESAVDGLSEAFIIAAAGIKKGLEEELQPVSHD
ncbi:MAG TPA: adenylyl-sulfate kinase [Candidatus Latescibacteria bacterium]|nr:adenylyl-sulfate kinase [Candidatus Latescibacterota bacterium]